MTEVADSVMAWHSEVELGLICAHARFQYNLTINAMKYQMGFSKG